MPADVRRGEQAHARTAELTAISDFTDMSGEIGAAIVAGDARVQHPMGGREPSTDRSGGDHRNRWIEPPEQHPLVVIGGWEKNRFDHQPGTSFGAEAVAARSSTSSTSRLASIQSARRSCCSSSASSNPIADGR